MILERIIYEINNKKKLLIKLDTHPHACLSTQNKRENIHLEIDRNFVTLNEWDTSCFVEINYRLFIMEGDTIYNSGVRIYPFNTFFSKVKYKDNCSF